MSTAPDLEWHAAVRATGHRPGRDGSYRVAFALAVTALLVAAPHLAQELVLDTVKLPDGEFRFRTQPPTRVDVLPAVPDEDTQVGSTPSYTLIAAMGDIHLSKYNYFHYLFYLRSHAAEGGVILRYFAQGFPVGSFGDQFAEVAFAVRDAARTESGVIRLPVFSLGARQYIESPEMKGPAEVRFADDRLIFLTLKNAIDLPIVIRRTSEAVERTESLWNHADLVLSDKSALRECELAPGSVNSNLLAVRVAPRSFQAFASSFLPLARQPIHERIDVKLDYSTRGGAPHTMTIEVPIRFLPWGPTLFLAVALGALLGSLIPVLRQRRRLAVWLPAAGAAVLSAFVAEAIAMVLVANDSQFRLLGIDLDPYQVLPAGLIGSLIGLTGLKTVTALKGIAGRPSD